MSSSSTPCDRDRLLRDIRDGIRLKPTNTNDRSKPIIVVDGEKLKKVQVLPQEQEQQEKPQMNGIAIPPPPPPPPPQFPPLSIVNSNSNLSKMKKKSSDEDTAPVKVPNPAAAATADRDALMQAIRQGVTLRKITARTPNSADDEKLKKHHAAAAEGDDDDHHQHSRRGRNGGVAEECEDKGVLEQPVQQYGSSMNSRIAKEQQPSSITTFGSNDHQSEEPIVYCKKLLHVSHAPAAVPDSSNSDCRPNYKAIVTPAKQQKQIPPPPPPPAAANPQSRPPPQKAHSVAKPAVVETPETAVKTLEPRVEGPEFVLNGYVSGAKAIWEKRSSQEHTPSQPPQPQAYNTNIIITKSTSPLRNSNGSGAEDLAPQAPAGTIAVDTTFSIAAAVPDFPPNGGTPPPPPPQGQDKTILPRVDHLRRAYEEADVKPAPSKGQLLSNTDASMTVRRPPKTAAAPVEPSFSSSAIRSRSHDSLDNDDDDSSRNCQQPATAATTTMKATSRFLPDVGALKQKFEERTTTTTKMANNGPPSSKQQQNQTITSVSTSNVSSGYSSGSPSPKSYENGGGIGRFQYNNGNSSAANRHNHRLIDQIDSANSKSKPIDIATTTSCHVTSNPNYDLVGPFKANMTTLGGGDAESGGVVKKNRNYYQKNAPPSSSHPQNMNETATWIVKKGSVPNIVSKYSVCEHLETLHQKKLSNPAASPSSLSSSSSADSSNSSENAANVINHHQMDGEVARLLGIPFEKLKELRFEIDVNDPEGSLIRIQKRYNETA